MGQSEGYKFLQAIKDGKGDEVTKFLDKPGATVINAKDITSGDGALHIVVRRQDSTYLNYLLARGADPNLRNERGETPLLIASSLGSTDMIETLVKHGANVNMGNASGETALIRAVQRRDTTMVRSLIDLGADPDQKDLLQGSSARDYAHQDTRTPAIASLIDAAPKKVRKAVSGPKL
jgi:ankyrin repeat protein